MFFVNKNKNVEQTDTVSTEEEQVVSKVDETENIDNDTTDTNTQEAKMLLIC